jgi:ketosteroid isomerase-like protein
MTREEDRLPFLRAHETWAAGDLEGFMTLFADDIVYIVNVDGIQVPYALSAVGKHDVRQRLEILLMTFYVTTFAIENIVHEAEFSRSRVHGVYLHKRTGEILDLKLRFVCWIADGKIKRLEEYHDAPFVEAYERFVFRLQQEADLKNP